MQISVESTPNPATLKFQFDFDIPLTEGVEINNPGESDFSPLAAKIFGFPWTSKIFLGKNFISVTKQDWVDWESLAEPLRGLIQEHFEAGEPAIIEAKPADAGFVAEDTEIVRKIKSVLANEIRPFVAMDGGDIVFHNFSDGILQVKMQGSCNGCPSAAATLKDGVEVRMKELIPEVLEVQTF